MRSGKGVTSIMKAQIASVGCQLYAFWQEVK